MAATVLPLFLLASIQTALGMGALLRRLQHGAQWLGLLDPTT